jgi:hypothetical protein
MISLKLLSIFKICEGAWGVGGVGCGRLKITLPAKTFEAAIDGSGSHRM